ncbi:hypothetical protein H4219_005783 [Mycoemilia scoparia]|uniref:Methionine aminopeptidase n=1 Tax=Mycoemilia scoparia TaxID=417184 RepID=A0A9W7ZMN0_9FUNG|nr:hypothetical protein H4219_005783 [Mycoemilia scoparia]
MGTQDLIPIITDLQDLTSLRNICRLSSQILKFAGKNLIYPGITTQEIDSIVHTSIVDDLKAYPSPLNYSGFPNSICTSINNIICHGIPDSRPLADSDIINIDVTLFKDGFHGDTSCTFLVNPDAVDALGKELVEATKEALDIGIRVCGPGVPFREIGNAISEFALINGFSVSEDLTGHGIGRHFHQPPLVFHHENDEPEVMKPGMVFTIEPILCQGESEAFLWPDGWTISTADGGRSAQFEHTVLVTEDGVEVLTE